MAGIGVEELGFLSSAEIVKAIQYNSKVLYVDSNFTGISTGGFFSPFKSFEALNTFIDNAGISSNATYLIYVKHAIYNPTDQIGRGITFYFEPNTTINVTTAIILVDFDQYSFKSYGYLKIVKSAPNFDSTPIFIKSNGTTTVYVQFIEYIQIGSVFNPLLLMIGSSTSVIIDKIKATLVPGSSGMFDFNSSSNFFVNKITANVGLSPLMKLNNCSNMLFQNLNIETSDSTTSEGRIRMFGNNSDLVFKNITFDILNFLFFINNITTTLTNSAFINCNKRRTGKFFFIDNLATCTVPAIGCSSSIAGVAGTGTWTNSGQTLIQY